MTDTTEKQMMEERCKVLGMTPGEIANEVRRKRSLRRQNRHALLAQLETLVGAEITAVGLSSDMVPILVLQRGRRRWQIEVCSDETAKQAGVLVGL
jgi:hypothetical protein